MKLRKDKWEYSTLDQICNISVGSTPLRTKKEYWTNGTIPWFTIDDIRENGRVIYDTKQRITDLAFKKSSVKFLPENSVLLCCTASVGEYAITKIPLTTNQQFIGLVIKADTQIMSEFLFHFSSTLKFKLLQLSGKTTIDFVPIYRIKNLPIPLPPLSEQKQIAALFQSIETAMEQVDGQEKKLKELRKSLINKLTKQNPEFGTLLSKSTCKEYSIGDLAIEVPDRTDNPQKSGIPKFIGLEDFESGELTIQKFSSTEKLVSAMKLCKQGDVLFARRNAYLKRASLTEFDAVCSGDVIVIRPNDKIILPKFLILVMNTDEFWEFAISNAAGTMSKRVKWRDLATYSFELPDIKIQAKILGVFYQLEATLSHLKQQKATLKLLKQNLLNEILG